MSFSRSRLTIAASFCGILALFLSACNLPMQSDPSGQNSGSPQNAQGAFNSDDPNAVSGGVGKTLSVYNVYTTITTSITVTSTNTSTTSANQNVNTLHLPPDEQFLTVNLTIKNLAKGNTALCPLNICTEYVNPLSNFRLLDPNGRNWPTTTGAAEDCAPLSLSCNSRRWVDESANGIAAGGSFSAFLNFIIPTSAHTFTLYYAAYRFNDTATDTGAPASGGASGADASSTPATTPAATGTGTPAATGTPTAGPTAVPTPPSNQPTLAKITISA